ncbi:hypothetical protein MF1_05040 [Bartonella quintana]|uniref:hypothetical protein n=1 Tax=Bartonella quintana TaxID=803 RepID=UPI001316E4F9|nr:hypothetical protein MF1_05040 [Bartonella quintana]
MADALKIGIRGLGTVGISVFGFYVKKQKVWLPTVKDQSKLLLVSTHDKDRNRGIDLGDVKWFDSLVEMAVSGKIDVFVELIRGELDVVHGAVEKALEVRNHVVTANKALLAKHEMEFAFIQKKNVFSSF